MPCPIRFGPPPSTIILLRAVGLASHSSSYVEYIYAVSVENSAAQVSTRLYTGRTLNEWRSSRIVASLVLSRVAIRASEKPLRFIARKLSALMADNEEA